MITAKTIGRSIDKTVLGRSIDLVRQGSLLVAIPLDTYDITGMTGYTSAQIDAWFNGIAALGEPYPASLKAATGNANPTSASATARTTLYDAFVLIEYNTGFTG